jgi:hypothetical protein
MKKVNDIRITKTGIARLNLLLSEPSVNSYHKTLLRAIKDRVPKKNVSKADCDIFETISNQYGGV